MALRCEILTTREMRAVEAAAMASGSVTGLRLMERAGEAVAAQVTRLWPRARKAVILCGPGNNGGDGYVVARLLRGQGWQLRVAALAPPSTPDAAAAAAAWGGQAEPLPALSDAVFGPEVICLDALFGTGLTRVLTPEIARILQRAARLGSPVVAVDILSGLCADSGRVLGSAELPAAALTVTFQRPKPGHVLGVGGDKRGRLCIADIGIDAWMGAAGNPARLAGPSAALLKCAGHKYDHGHVLVLSGGPGRGGAARLAARAALRVGAGLVTLACPGAALPENAARLDAIMLRDVEDVSALRALLSDRRLNALCLGPGLGLQRARDLVPGALESTAAVVLDADALTAFADDPGALFAISRPDMVLTPHGGEFARLFPDIWQRLAAPALSGPAFSRLDAVRQAADRAGCVVLLKGPDTVIAAPGGEARIAAAVAEDAAPGLATAGSGDVLSGLIAGLLARGFVPLDAAALAAWLHAEAARQFGPGLIAEDLPETLPKVLRGLAQ